MPTPLRILVFLLLAALGTVAPSIAAQPDDGGRDARMEHARARNLLDIWTGDLPEMLENHRVRALVISDRTNFFIDATGQPRGFMYELGETYRKKLNAGRKKRELRMDVTYVPVLMDEIIPALLAGRGDVIAHTLTVTPEREKLVDFTTPLLTDVRAVLVTRKGAPRLTRMEDFGGREIHVPRGTSHVEHLRALNLLFSRHGVPPVKIVEAENTLGTANLLEMLSAGIIGGVVCDDHQARLWARVLPGLVINDAFPLNAGGKAAWAVRKNNPLLLQSLNKAIADMTRDTKDFEARFAAYHKNTRWLANPFLGSGGRDLMKHFQSYARTYGFDWLQTLAQGFQESRLDNTAVSHMGAVGIMQVLPSTGRDLGFADIRPAEYNIHAGVKYMNQLRRQFDGEAMTPENRFHFALAAYNAGPNRVKRLREMAAEDGLDPNVWFGSVEREALRVVGLETVNYVRNINNYFIAYRLSAEIIKRRDETMKNKGRTAPSAGGAIRS
ncbi:transporter substrate-binding domain-containing protein [Desulfovibrio aminophilus]|uniref:transporter substrate-binding domain-containing protein n=1 Tax=Desulfovibrio aminophilus TaxID=81425 RepID=UPI003396F8A8